jgi:hypothetical protein
LTDQGASRINLTAQDSTVFKLGGIAPPRDPTDRRDAGDGVRNRLTDFSRSVSGAYYFAPSLDVLNELAGPDVDR